MLSRKTWIRQKTTCLRGALEMSKIAKGIGKGLKKVGEGLKKAVKGVGKVFKKVVTSKIFWVVVAVALIAYSAGAFTPAVTSAAPAATQATAVASTTTATAGAAGAGAGAGAAGAAGAGTAASSTLAPITVAPQALAGGGMSAGVAPVAATGAATGAGASAAAGTAGTAGTAGKAIISTPVGIPGPAAGTAGVGAGAGGSGGVIGALKGGLGSVASWVGNNPWPVALGMQAGGAALQANAATDMAEDERKRREGNYNIQDMSPAYNLAPSAKPNVSQQVDVGQQTIASTQVNAPRRAESAKTGRSLRREDNRNRRALIDSKMKAGLNNEMNEDKSKGVA